MAHLVLARKWIKETFEEGSRPTLKEVETWVDDETLPGCIIGPKCFVDADRFAICGTKHNAPAKGKLTPFDLLS